MRVDHAGHGDHSSGLDSFVERASGGPFRRTDKCHPVAVDHDRASVDDIALLVHCDDQRVTN